MEGERKAMAWPISNGDENSEIPHNRVDISPKPHASGIEGRIEYTPIAPCEFDISVPTPSTGNDEEVSFPRIKDTYGPDLTHFVACTPPNETLSPRERSVLTLPIDTYAIANALGTCMPSSSSNSGDTDLM